MERKLVEVAVAAIYAGTSNNEVDNAKKALIFNPKIYEDWDLHVYTRRNTLYGADENYKNKSIKFGIIKELIEDDDGNNFFLFDVPEALAKVVNQIEDLVVVCQARVYTEDGVLKARKPRYTLFRYNEYLDNEKKKIERQVFRKGSVVPKNWGVSIKDRVDMSQQQVQNESNESVETNEAVEIDMPQQQVQNESNESVETNEAVETVVVEETKAEYIPVTPTKLAQFQIDAKAQEELKTLVQKNEETEVSSKPKQNVQFNFGQQFSL